MNRIQFIEKYVIWNNSILDIWNWWVWSCIPKIKQPIAKYISKNSKEYIWIEKYEEKYKNNINLWINTVNIDADIIWPKNIFWKFDIVFMGLSFMYCLNLQILLFNIKNHLNENWKLILDVPNLWYFPRIIKYIFLWKYSMANDIYNNYIFDIFSITKLLEKNWFIIEKKYFIRWKKIEYFLPKKYSQFIWIVCKKWK